MKPKVYIETTIPSFYHEDRVDPEAVARKEWTRQWWDGYSNQYFLVTSPAVIDELNSGDYPKRTKLLELIDPLPIVPVEPEVFEIVETYIKHKVMPEDPVGDALHLALASYHKCAFFY